MDCLLVRTTIRLKQQFCIFPFSRGWHNKQQSSVANFTVEYFLITGFTSHSPDHANVVAMHNYSPKCISAFGVLSKTDMFSVVIVIFIVYIVKF